MFWYFLLFANFLLLHVFERKQMNLFCFQRVNSLDTETTKVSLLLGPSPNENSYKSLRFQIGNLGYYRQIPLTSVCMHLLLHSQTQQCLWFPLVLTCKVMICIQTNAKGTTEGFSRPRPTKLFPMIFKTVATSYHVSLNSIRLGWTGTESDQNH